MFKSLILVSISIIFSVAVVIAFLKLIKLFAIVFVGFGLMIVVVAVAWILSLIFGKK